MARRLPKPVRTSRITGRSIAPCEQAASELGAATGRRCRAYQADVTMSADVERLAADVERDFGRIDILINNAGTNIRGPIEQLTEADWDTVLDTNLKGPFLCARAIGPGMVRRGWGRVINLGSVLGVIALAGPGALRVVEGGHHQPHARARARVGGHRRNRKCALSWRVRHRDESTTARRSGQIPGVRQTNSDGTLGRTRRARRRRACSSPPTRPAMSRGARSSSMGDGRRR